MLLRSSMRDALFTVFVSVVLTAGLAAGPAAATSFNIDFGSEFGTLPNTDPASSSQTGFWNEVNTPSAMLRDLSGNVTGVTVAITADNIDTFWPDNQPRALQADFFSSNVGNAWTVSIAGLSNGVYDLVFYAPDGPFDNGTGIIDANGSRISNNLNGSALLADAVVTNGNLFIQSIPQPVNDSFQHVGERGLSGLQIIQTSATVSAQGNSDVPGPASLATLLGGLALLWGVRQSSACMNASISAGSL